MYTPSLPTSWAFSIYRIFLLQSGLKMLGVWHVSRELSEHCTLIVDQDESACPRLLSPHSAPRHGALPCPTCRAEPKTTTWARTEGAAQPPLLAVSWSWQLLQMTMAQTLHLSQTKDPRQPSVCYRDSEGFMGSWEVEEDLGSATVIDGLKLNFKCLPAWWRLGFI